MISKRESAKMNYDDLLITLGQFGRYQKFILCFIFASWVPFSMHALGIVFIAGVPDHTCAVSGLAHLNLSDDVIRNLTIPLEEKDGISVYSSCTMYDRNYTGWTTEDVWRSLSSSINTSDIISCRNGWVYDKSIYSSTIVTQWDLVCDDRWLQATAASVFMAGLMVGVVVSGISADKFGRFPAYCTAMLIMVVSGIAVTFSPNYITFCVIRFVIGATTNGVFIIAFVLAIEMVGPAYRARMAVYAMYAWTVGYLLMNAMAYGLRDWFSLSLTIACPMALLLVTPFFIPESIPWLYSRNKKEKAEEIVYKVARWNHVQVPSILDISISTDRKSQIRDLFRTKQMSFISLILFFNWFVLSLSYYGISLNTSNLGGDHFVNATISAAVAVPAYFLIGIAFDHLGRRWPFCISTLMAGAILLATLAVPSGLNWIIVMLAMVGKAALSASFCGVYLYTAELYPTVVRNTGVSAGTVFARIGGVVAPYVAQLSSIGTYVPLVIFGALSIAAGLLALYFPETKGVKLPETMKDFENIRRDKQQLAKDNTVSAFTIASGTFKGELECVKL